MGNREQALALLAGSHSGTDFFSTAAEAVCIGFGCEFVGIGLLSKDGSDIVLLAQFSSDGVELPKSYKLASSPCADLFQRPPEESYGFVPDGLAEAFPDSDTVSLLSACSFRGQVFYDENGKPVGHVFAVSRSAVEDSPDDEAFFRLVSQRVGAEYVRMRAQQRLQINQRRYDLAVSQAGVWDWDLVNDTVYFSPRFSEMLGFDRPNFDKLARRFLLHLVHEEQRDEYQAGLKAHFEEPAQPYNAELRLLTARHGHRWFHARGQSMVGDDGKPTRFAGILTEIEDRKRAEVQLRESKRRLSEAHRMAGVGSWVAYPGDAIMEWQESAGTLFGDLHGQEITTDQFLARVHEEDRLSVEIALDHCLRRGLAFDLVHRFQTPDGGRRWLHQHAEPELNAAGDVISVKGSTVDVTKLKQAEESLRRAKEEAEYANRAKSEFLANMSHELRTPLNAVIGFGSLLSQEVYGVHSDSRYQEYAEDICASGQHLLDLINDILDVARIEAGSMDLEEYELDLKGINATCLKLVGGRATKANLTIETKVDPVGLRLYADGRRVKQILINLLSNSVKFTPSGGSITVVWSLESECVILEVIDTGVGIDEKILPRLFEPFSRGEDSLTREYEGTGLGLSLVRKLTLLHDGDVVVKSKPGAGTTVRVSFPSERTIMPNVALASAASG
ncbi:PAS domain S-box protein [Hwanghaeella grinnelliae]|uniref:histidine kinase n=1 Tax=Hwanghaeella grinnelliae TaxID=2500179 RepID=A0A3S2Z6R8_9PROT|nr:PAS domain-containing sensor histidine kinase [Hwanghaeella grinnelliae]RVU34603.1 PAS domain S-box protein [Hwanghaeella grinnelliae]